MKIFELLTDDELNTYTYLKTYKAGDIIFNEEALCNQVGYIISGEVKIITLTHTEKEEVVTLLKKNQYFGDILTFAKENAYLGHGICLKETIVRYITKDNLLTLFTLHTEFLEAFLNLISTKALYLKQENKLFKHKNIRDRITHYLLSNNKSSKTYISSIANFARILSIPRPSVSREITSMIEDGIITKGKDLKGTYIILNNKNAY